MCAEIFAATSFGAEWVLRNDCQGLFTDEVFRTRAEAIEAADRDCPEWRDCTNAVGEKDGKIVPVVLVEILEGHPAYRRAFRENERREADLTRWRDSERAKIVAALRARAA